MCADKSSPYYESLIGLMIGDTLGLPYEGLSKARLTKWRVFPLRQRFFIRYGMISDDTEHALMTIIALLRAGGNADQFEHQLIAQLRWWLLRLPSGVGSATARSLIKHWLPMPKRFKSVYSAGNGPAMRAPIIGLAYGHNPRKMRTFVELSTQVTHGDPKATIASITTAWATYKLHQNPNMSFESFRKSLNMLISDLQPSALLEFNTALDNVAISLSQSETADQLSKRLGCHNAATGYIYITVPIALFLAWRHRSDFAAAMTEVIPLGGDVDTNAAVLGGIIGAIRSDDATSETWLNDICDWPYSKQFTQTLCNACDKSVNFSQPVTVRTWHLGIPLIARNLCFLAIVLTHGVRRLLPPYPVK